MSKARPNNRRVFRNRPAIKYHSQFHNVIGSVMRNRSGWIKANEEDEKKVDFFWVETLFMHEQFDNIYFAEHVKGKLTQDLPLIYPRFTFDLLQVYHCFTLSLSLVLPQVYF